MYFLTQDFGQLDLRGIYTRIQPVHRRSENVLLQYKSSPLEQRKAQSLHHGLEVLHFVIGVRKQLIVLENHFGVFGHLRRQLCKWLRGMLLKRSMNTLVQGDRR